MSRVRAIVSIMKTRIPLSPPHMSGHEQAYVDDAFRSNWLTSLGPNVTGFEAEFARWLDLDPARVIALNSGTSAIHLALVLLGVGPGDEVFGSTFTFCASVNPIAYLGAKPVLIDSEERSWNMDPELLREALQDRARQGRLPKAVVLVHLYGQAADLDAIEAICSEYGVPLVEDAAEALGATCRDRRVGTVGRLGIFSFNGNKVITTSGGGMLVGQNPDEIAHARHLATQAREPAPHYQHKEIGYNYRLSNVLAGIGRGQLKVLDARIAARRRVFETYASKLADVPGLTFMPDAGWGTHTRWLTSLTIDRAEYGATAAQLHAAMEGENIESRPIWKPMHLQPVFAQCATFGGSVSEQIFAQGLCLPSGSALSEDELDRIANVVREVARPATARSL